MDTENRQSDSSLPFVEASVLNRLQAEEFGSATDMATFCSKWLALNCSTIRGCRLGAVYSLQGKELHVAGRWPHKQEGSRQGGMLALTAAARACQVEGGGVLLDARVLEHLGVEAGGTCYLAVPVEVERTLWGFVALLVEGAREDLRSVLERVQWATGWFSWFQVRGRSQADEQVQMHMRTALDLLAASVDYDTFEESAMALVNELAARFECDRVSLGMLRSHKVRLSAVSGAAVTEGKMEVTQRIASAMEEALDQDAPTRFPPPSKQSAAQRRVVRSHRELCLASGLPRTALTLPLRSGGGTVGAITLEREADRPFSESEEAMLEATAELLGPLIEIQHKEDRFIGVKLIDSLRFAASRLLGPGHVGAKAAALSLLAVALFFSLAQWEYRVSADCLVEAEVQRVAAAPFDGFLHQAPVRAGDLVSRGQLMARLDDRQLQQRRIEVLERLRQSEQRYRQALGEHQASDARILSSLVDQVKAELALLEDLIEQTHIRAPFDGVVVRGDLSRQMGAPVQRGDVLFEVAPLDRFLLVLEVDERDIGELQEGQQGYFRLLSRPHETHPLEVSLITPVSSAEEGANVFRVEARLQEAPPWLRPGMEGVAKVHIDRRLILWIWTHRVVDFIRIHLWL
ncbi:MAG: HlyD family efflux transporter periplasmic adaptor subunit [Acidobacteriota bacterium]